MSESATFLASLPPIMSAIRLGGDGMRLQLDIPESELGQAIKLVAWRDVVLHVTIQPDCKTETINAVEARSKRKSERTTANG